MFNANQSWYTQIVVKNQKSIIITGTHHTPAIELINLLRQDTQISWKISYIGHQYPTDTHIAHTIIPKLKIPFYNLNCGKFDRKDILKTIIGTFSTIKAFFQSLTLISKIKPDVIVSFCGYVSVPVIIAAYFKKIPSITHEQTLTLSLSTKINRFFVNKIALSFNDPSQIKKLPPQKVVITGNLLRQAIFNRQSPKYQKLITDNRPLIYVTGGNQGSNFLNQLIINLLPKLKDKFNIIHQTGNNYPVSHFPNYYPTEFVDIEDIGWVLNHAQIVISRAGANTCQELDILNKKSIVIPLPFTQQDEQLLNARWLQQRHPKSVVIIPQSKAETNTIYQTILQLSQISSPLTSIKPSINLKLLNLIHELI
jgi:UDP-N-acetylglucosamine--N-acetylmuramyl-(pentapeptide) pyrophosphoryl-undecaprenol N-acetylglucosamine transferase